jgi:hypothetical protein
MPQRHLPLFPQGATHITLELAFMKENGRVTYLNGHMPVFIHERQGDLPDHHQSILCERQCQTSRHRAGLWGDDHQREAFREAVSREGACWVLCPTPRAGRRS